jgi:hypothetical protein
MHVSNSDPSQRLTTTSNETKPKNSSQPTRISTFVLHVFPYLQKYTLVGRKQEGVYPPIFAGSHFYPGKIGIQPVYMKSGN